jgi:spore germination protein KC
MIKNKLKEGLITLTNVAGSDTDITLEIFENRTKLTPRYVNGRVSMIIDITQVVSIMEIQGTKNFMKEDNLKLLQIDSEKKIKSEVQHLISKLQKNYNSDVLGFTDTFMREKPKVSKLLKESGENLFENINPEVNVHRCTLRRSI